MDLIYTDRNLKDVGTLKEYTFDFDMTSSKDFEIIVSNDNPFVQYAQKGSFVYIEGTEYGGKVDKLTISTSDKKATVHGINYRALLDKKIIEPLKGDDYRIVSGKFTDILNAFLEEFKLTDVFECEDVNLNIPSYQFDRYTSLLSGIDKMLKTYGYIADLYYNGEKRKIVIATRKAVDYSDLIQYSEDDSITFEVTRFYGGVNHLICLGKGELKERTVIHLYADTNGNISKNQSLFGLDEIATTYDYSSVESVEELETKGIEKLKELMSKDDFEITVDNIDLKLGDIIGGTEKITGIVCKDIITNIIVKIEDDVLTTEYKIGG